MAKFLNTSGTNYFLEQIIKDAKDRLILISPYLRLNDRIKELLADKNRLKIDVRIVYGKSELPPREIEWLRQMTYIRTSFCKNLHAKCYLNEEACIITSLNLYEFSQVNNNEMGVLARRSEDRELFQDAYDEALRIIRISDEEQAPQAVQSAPAVEHNISATPDAEPDAGGKLTTSKLARKLGIKTNEVLERAVVAGYLLLQGEQHSLTKQGSDAGVEFIAKSRFGPYYLWPEDLPFSGGGNS